MAIQIVLVAIGSYLLGSVPAAYVAIKLAHGTDIREHGTGNVGAANVLSIGPKWLAFPVALFDIGKGAFCVWIAGLLDLDTGWQVGAGLLAIIGHNWPVFLGFRGGRGIFASLGVITILSPKLGLIILILPYLFAPFRQVSLGVFLALASLPFFSWFLGEPLDIDDRLPVTLGLAAVAMIAFSRRLFVHRKVLSQSVPWGRIILNRLIFDRDIADRQAWIRGGNSEPGGPATSPTDDG
jgi:glycerol-3-phosphate acyltransferase PlsY